MSNYSPLRYPGGKGKMYSSVLKILEDNSFTNYTYIEPFAGGANLALNLLFNGDVKNIILNDYDLAIYSVWYSILNYNTEFIELINNTEITLEEREKQKQIHENEKTDLLKLGFATFYLNRTNRSGIIKGGVIGGKNQTSKYLIDCRFNKKELISRIEKIYRYKNQIELYNEDAITFVSRDFNVTSFLFIDPPYYKKGPALYETSFTHKEHKAFAEKAKKLNVPWIMTYDDVIPIVEMYTFCESKKYELSYTLESKRMGNEIMFYSKDLEINF